MFTEPPRSSPQQDSGTLPSRGNGPPLPPQTDGGIHPVTFTDEYGNLAENSTTRELPTVSCYFNCNLILNEIFLIFFLKIRGVEIGIVVLGK